MWQVFTLSSLADRLKGVYKAMTEGKFAEGLRQVNVLLLLIPLTVVDTRREADELKELLTIARSAWTWTPQGPTSCTAAVPGQCTPCARPWPV